MPNTACRFTRTSDDLSSYLGTEDSYIVCHPAEGRMVYEVHSFYVNRNTPLIFVSAEQRLQAETYISELASTIGITSLTAKTKPNGSTYYDYTDAALKGVLDNLYTGLTIEGVVLTGIDHDDAGGRAYGITFTFEKPLTTTSSTDADNIPTFDPDGITDAIDLGTSTGIVTIDPSELETRYTVKTTATYATRGEAETAFKLIYEALNPQPLEQIDVAGKPQLVARYGAIRGTLANPLTALSIANVYPIEASQEDDGGMTISVTTVYSLPRYLPPASTSDTSVPHFKTVAVGNQSGRAVQHLDDLSFIRYTVTGTFLGTGSNEKADAVATALGYDPIFLHEVPRGASGSRGVVKAPIATSGSLAHSSLAADVTGLYIEKLEVTERRKDYAEITLTLVKSR